jgi:hypothetical protein
MSLTGKVRKVRSKDRKTLPKALDVDGEPFALLLAAALKREFGSTPGAVKSVARLALANERAVKNWFDAKNAPSGVLLVRLIRHSDEVLKTVLEIADRRELLVAKHVADARAELREVLSKLDILLAE